MIKSAFIGWMVGAALAVAIAETARPGPGIAFLLGVLLGNAGVMVGAMRGMRQ